MGHLIHISKRIDKRARGWVVNRDLDVKTWSSDGQQTALTTWPFPVSNVEVPANRLPVQ